MVGLLYCSCDFGLLLVLKAEMLYIDGLHLGHTTPLRGLLKILACAKLADSPSLLELSLEFLQCAFDVFTFFYGYDNHA